jgi:hypothetical protein
MQQLEIALMGEHSERGLELYPSGAARNVRYDTGGNVVKSFDDYGHEVTITPSASTNYAAPAQMNPGGTESLQTNFTYSSFMPASTLGPNNDGGSRTYDTYGRVATSTLATGGV